MKEIQEAQSAPARGYGDGAWEKMRRDDWDEAHELAECPKG